MKKTGILNSALSATIARLGHTDALVIGDAGLPIPGTVERIDLALCPGTPSFLDVLKAVGAEMQIEAVLMAQEFEQVSPDLFAEVMQLVSRIGDAQGKAIQISHVGHNDFKAATSTAKAVVRTGECTPYANIILYSGVFF